ncbi:MAG: hypothetical protein R3B13_16710 [Polyangiaceae bacterium]
MKVSSEAGDFVEIERINSGSGDVQVTVRVHHGTFSGETEAWIAQQSWFSFAQDLTKLEKLRQGEARLESMSPHEVALVFRSLDRAGHVGVEGTIGRQAFDGNVTLSFTVFAFDPAQLVPLAHAARVVSAEAG